LPQFLGFELCPRIRVLLAGEESYAYLDEHAAAVLAEERAILGPVLRGRLLIKLCRERLQTGPSGKSRFVYANTDCQGGMSGFRGGSVRRTLLPVASFQDFGSVFGALTRAPSGIAR